MITLVSEESIKNLDRVGICFYSTWAPFNKQLFKSLDKIEKEFSIPIYAADVDSFKGMIKRHQLESVPTFLLLDKHEEVGRIVGTVLISALRHFVREKLTDI